MKLNVGCGRHVLDGWTNVDAYTNADIQGDIRTLVFQDVHEVNMSHLLEHLPWAQTAVILERIRGWMIPGGTITIEVPDMKALMAHPPPDWVIYIYGAQSQPGEFHQTGFTRESLSAQLYMAGYQNVTCKEFLSDHPYRAGMPCLLAQANA